MRHHASVPNRLSENTDIVLGSDVEPCVWLVVEVDVAIVCACLPTLRPLFDRKVRRSRKRGQSVELAADGSSAPSNRRSGYEPVEGKANDIFLDLVRVNWAAVPSARNFLEWRNSSRVECDVEGRNADRAKGPSLAVGEWQVEHEVERKASEGSPSKACNGSEVATFAKVNAMRACLSYGIGSKYVGV